MKPERWQKVRKVFEVAVDLPEAVQAVFLVEACGDDRQLREEVEKLLDTDLQSEEAKRLAAGPGEVLREAAPSMVGAQLADYRIRRILGSGGMGTVYEAEQEQPRRTVALKTMRAGLQSESVRRRFEYESEILGRLRHPRIAQVYGAGTYRDEASGEDIPYFAMEFVEGARPLNVYVDEAGLGLEDVLNLFCEICTAVQYGHQQGFIHRDLKPANLLVDQEGQPKIIDFGIARPTDLVDMTVQTEGGQVLGTLQYMSPEQLDLDTGAIDTRVDVHALGVILYELLTGRAPFDLTGKGITEVGRILKDKPPERPSTFESPLTNRAVPAELDWIVLKAMDKDRDRRYGTASELASDIQRFLSHEPVVASPPSRAYRMRKFVRRNRLAFAAGVSVVLALVAGTVLATLGLMEAKREAAIHGNLNSFLRDVMKFARPGRGGREGTVAELMDDAALSVDAAYAEHPEYTILLRGLIGETYTSLGKFDRASEQLELALTLSEEYWGEDHRNTLANLNNLAVLESEKGNWLRAMELHRNVLERRLRALGDGHVDTANSRLNVGRMLFDEGEFAEAEELLRRALEVIVAERGEQHVEAIGCMAVLVSLFGETGRLEEGGILGRQAVALAERHLHERHPVAMSVYNNFANNLRRRGRLEEAVELFERCLEADREVYGEDHPKTIMARNNLAASFVNLGRFVEAEAEFRKCLEYLQRRGEESTLDALIFRNNLGFVLESQHKLEDAVGHYEESLSLAEPAVGIEHWVYAALQKGYGVALTAQERFPEAERQLLESLAVLKPSHGVGSQRVQKLLEALVELYEAWGKPDEADVHRAGLIGSGK